MLAPLGSCREVAARKAGCRASRLPSRRCTCTDEGTDAVPTSQGFCCLGDLLVCPTPSEQSDVSCASLWCCDELQCRTLADSTSCKHTINQSVCLSVNQSVNQSINQSVDRSIMLPELGLNWLIDWSIDQSINQFKPNSGSMAHAKRWQTERQPDKISTVKTDIEYRDKNDRQKQQKLTSSDEAFLTGETVTYHERLPLRYINIQYTQREKWNHNFKQRKCIAASGFGKVHSKSLFTRQVHPVANKLN